MPAGSDVALPHTFRPFGVRLAIFVLGGLLVLVVLVMWFALPAEIRAQFTALQLGTVIFLGLLFYAAGFALARSRLVAREDGLTVVNGYRTRRFEWNEVLAVSLRNGSPWAEIDLSDGTTVAAMGIQGSDGPRAMRQVREVRALVDRLTRLPPGEVR
jgi:Bacterial PH domain